MKDDIIIRKKKQSSLEKVIALFAPEDVGDLKNYVIKELIVPGIKNGIISAIAAAFNVNRPNTYGGYGYNSYSSYGYSHPYPYTSYTSYNYSQNQQRPVADAKQCTYFNSEPTFATEIQARRILKEMRERINEDQMISVNDYCELCHMKASPVDVNYGWCDLSSARVASVGGRWLIKLPKPIPLI